ncbi:hypothetical protein L6452_14977 [Arctium lappa]|uniref:Uncharacterized protein n=1 Tax=Arctium lappa TaxID=4217 RepID=A0ACB9CML3_ARCLA|nr:hypothetical protein L6452_14977 [Arctium lappa]
MKLQTRPYDTHHTANDQLILFVLIKNGVETLMKDLTMEDREHDAAEGKGKEAEENKKKDKPLKAYSRKNKKNTANVPDDSDFKLVPIIDIGSLSRSTRSATRAGLQKANELNESTPKKEGMDVKHKSSGYVGYLDLLMKQLMNAKGEAKKWLESATTTFPNDPAFDKYKNDLDNLFNTIRWTSIHGQSESKGEEKGFENSMATVVYEDIYTPVELDAWICGIPRPADETIDECERREKRLGDHLRSPYVQRYVDFNVTTEEKRVHEWALAALRDTL